MLSSRIFGFNQDLFDDSGRASPPTRRREAMLGRAMAVSYPQRHRAGHVGQPRGGLGACDDDVEFAFGLDLILDGLEGGPVGQGRRQALFRARRCEPRL